MRRIGTAYLKIRRLNPVVLATAALFIPLYLWRIVYPVSDWAIIFLMALAFLVFFGVFAPVASKYRARLSVEVRETSPLFKRLTGRVHAGFIALVFTVLALPVLAWQALTASWIEMIGFVAIGVASGSVSQGFHTQLHLHFSPWLARSAAITLGAWLVGAISIPLIIWINWAYVIHPGEIRMATLSQAVMISIDELPSRRGWISEFFSVFYALDGAKLWLMVQLNPSRWAAILYSLDAALIGFVVAQVSAFLTGSFAGKTQEPDT